MIWIAEEMAPQLRAHYNKSNLWTMVGSLKDRWGQGPSAPWDEVREGGFQALLVSLGVRNLFPSLSPISIAQ